MDSTEEIWKDIGIQKYAISNIGNIKGADGIRLLKPYYNRKGYINIDLYNNGIRKHKKIHQLVLEAFVGPRPNGFDIDHINRIRDDNRLENLRYCSKSENNLNRCDTKPNITETDPVLRAKIVAKQWRQENKEKISEYNKIYKLKNKEKKEPKL
jgi:hypothetical protein